MSDDTQLVERVEAKLNLERAASITVTNDAGGLAETLDYAQIFEVAKFMATSGPMVPSFCQGRPGVCLGIVLQAREWRMMPYQVARMAYVVSNRKTGEQVVSYMSQLIHAVIESRAPIADRLSVHYDGEGDDLTCTVSAPLRNRDGTPGRVVELTSPTLGERKRALRMKITVGDDGEEASVKGSPLWVTKPKQQLFYDTSRDWARMFFPDVLMGVYSREEMEDQGWTEKRIPPASAAEPDSGFTRRLTSQAISLGLLRWGNSPLLEVALKVKGPPSDTSRLIARTAIEACGIEEARARIAALEETLTESRAWLNASLGLVEGDDGPPNWDGIREHIEEIDAILTPAQQMDRITGENDGLTAALNEAQA